MCEPWMFFSHVRVFPLIAFLGMVVFIGRRVFGQVTWWSFPEKTPQNLSAKISSGKIPEELKRAGQQTLDNLDWDIRFLEKQCFEVSDPKERKNLEEKLRRKREEYHSVVERLEL